ncbi:MAG: four-helix bundle copper-binding protein [Isosphaeraceae bacterium]
MMDRRELMGVLGDAAAGLAAVTGGRAVAQEAGGDMHDRCAKDCATAMVACNKGFHHCYRQVAEGNREHAKTMHMCVDCADICGTAAALVARMSPLMAHTCRAAADCCEGLIAQCDKLDDLEMKGVAKACRACVKSCREMVKAMGDHAH